MVSSLDKSECQDGLSAWPSSNSNGSVLASRAALVMVGLIPVAHILFLIAFTCSNSLAHDYQNVVPTVAAISEPGYNWLNFVNDTSMGPHCLLSSTLIHYCSAHLTDWNARSELFFGVFLAVLRVVLLTDCIGSNWNRLSKWVLLTTLLWLSFGTSMCSTLLFGNPCISAGVGLLGYVLALWGVSKCERRNLALFLVFAGGAISASFGQFWALATWSTILVAVCLCKKKQPSFYVIWLLGALVSALELATMAQRPTSFHPRINFVGFINVLGRSFTNDIGNNCLPIQQSEIVGCVGLLFVALLAFLHLRNRTSASKLAVPLAMLGFGVLGALIISMSRDSIAPWYSLFAMHFWIGILSGALILIEELPYPKHGSILRFGPRACAILPLIFVFGLYLQTNFSYKDKDFFRRTHAPCSESASRYFRTAPTYGEIALFAGQVGDIRVWSAVCEPLWRHNWSAFAPKQQWALQGDFLLSSVTVNEHESTEATKWIDGRKLSRKRHWDDPEQLNLATDLRNRVSWQIDLPEKTKSASLNTAVTLPETRKRKASLEPVFFNIEILELVQAPGLNLSVPSKKLIERRFQVTDSWNSIDIAIGQFAGKKLRIDFTGVPSAAEKVAILRFPTISVNVERELRTKAQSARLEVRPSNTDLSPDFPLYTPEDVSFVAANDKLFRLEGMHAIKQDSDGSVIYQLDNTSIPSLTLAPAISINAREFSHLVLETGASSDVYPRLICVQVVVNGTSLRQLLIPMLFDNELHKYSYDLKLLELESNETITGVKILPTYLDRIGQTKVRSLRFIRRGENDRL